MGLALYGKKSAVRMEYAAGTPSLRFVLLAVCLLLLATAMASPALAQPQQGFSNKKKKQVKPIYKKSEFCPPSRYAFTSFTYSRNNWTCQGSANENGLRLTHVTLGPRYMSEYLCVPYIGFKTSQMSANMTWVSLQINAPNCRLIDIREEGMDTIRAEWSVEKWNLAGGGVSPNCLRVIVRWKFEAVADRNPPKKPPFVTGPFWANQLTPNVTYLYERKNNSTENLTGFWVPLRMSASVNGTANPDRVALIRDCEPNESGSKSGVNAYKEPCLSPDLDDTFLYPRVATDKHFLVTLPGVAVRNLVNNGNSISGFPERLNTSPPGWGQGQEAAMPLKIAVRESAVTNGGPNDNNFITPGQKRVYAKRGNWDNIHITYRPAIDLPVPIPPGCPECFHYHWRWFGALGNDSTGWGGVPMVYGREYSKQQQDVVIGPVNGPDDNKLQVRDWSASGEGNLNTNGQSVVWLLAWDVNAPLPISQTFFSDRGIFFKADAPNFAVAEVTPEGGSAAIQQSAPLAPESAGGNEYRTVSVRVGESYTYRVTLKNPGATLRGSEQDPLSLSCVVPGNARIESWEIEGADTDLSEDGTLWTARFDKLPKGAKVQARVRVRFLSPMESGKPTPVTFQTKTGDKDASNTGALYVRYNTRIRE